MIVTFDVSGQPVPKGSFRAFAHRTTGQIIVQSQSRGSLKAWETLIGFTARESMRRPADGPIILSLAFTLRLPKSRDTRPRRPDLDKLVRAVLDGLTGVAYHDDAQVISLAATKEYGGSPGVKIILVTADERLEQSDRRV